MTQREPTSGESDEMRTVTIEVPADVFTPNRGHGYSRGELDLWCPFDMTPDRFREIAEAKGARLYNMCYELGPRWGPMMFAEWFEGGVKVTLRGVVDVEAGRRDIAARKASGIPWAA